MTIPPIRWDWNPRSPVCFVDLETQSAVDLKKHGNWPYVTDDSTRLLSAVFKLPGSKPITWVPRPLPGLTFPNLVTGEEIPNEIRELMATHVWVAHNAEGFDALVWARLFQWDQPRWRDTQPMARAMGLPGSLDKLSRWFGGAGKSDAGSRAMKLLTKPGVVGTLPLWNKMLQYNVDDVNMLETIYDQVKPVLKYHARYLAAHSIINDRGVRVDAALTNQLTKLWVDSKYKSQDDIAELTGGELTEENIRSNTTMHKWLKKHGFELTSLRREEVEAFLADPGELPEDTNVEHLALVAEVLRLRSHVTRIGEAKLARLLSSIVDGRLRYWAVYHGAATGRYSSRGVQMHNLPRGNSDLDVESMLATLAAGETVDLGDDQALTLNTLTRSCFIADPGEDLLISDYAAIEARCLAWMSDETRMLDQYHNKEDLYLDMASKLFGRQVTKADKSERHIGKQIILGAGYGMSGDRFDVYCRLAKVDLAKHNLTGAACIKAYRDGYPAVPKLWKAMEQAAMDCVKGRGDQVAGRCRFMMRDSALVVVLPSGREIYYQRAQVVKRIPHWAILKRMSVAPRDTLVYMHPQGFEKTLYGALIVENCDQAICSDLLREAQLRYEKAGLKTVVHVHDELVATGSPDDIHKAVRIMAKAPRWAAGFPISVEGFNCPRYVKVPWKQSSHATS